MQSTSPYDCKLYMRIYDSVTQVGLVKSGMKIFHWFWKLETKSKKEWPFVPNDLEFLLTSLILKNQIGLKIIACPKEVIALPQPT